MNLSEPFIRRPVATSLLMAALAFVGIASYPFLPVAPLPQVDFPTIQVQATFQGASAETMASSVATFIPSITVPLAILGSCAAMYLLNFSLDNLSLMALTIAVGFVVDDAIVVVENIYRHIEDGASPLEAALTGSREIGFTVLSISCSLIAVFIPLLLMGGIIGRLFREFALTVTASIVVSAVVSLTLAPMLCARFMRRHSHQHGWLYRAIEAVFDGMLAGYRRLRRENSN